MVKKISKRKKSTYKKNKISYAKIAKERIDILISEADKNFSKHPKRSHRYAELAHKLKLKYKVKLTPKVKRRLCKKCHKFMVPGKNCKIRIHNSRLIYTCGECGAIRRFDLK
jgi:ribonuclease P protein subunit RPR2